MTEDAPARDHPAWQESRRAAVTAPTGNLALLETRWGADDPEAGLAGRPATVPATRLQRFNPLTGGFERGVRLWDAHAAAIQNFKGIPTFPYDPSWRVEARSV